MTIEQSSDKYDVIGLVEGSAVRNKTFLDDIFLEIKSLVNEDARIYAQYIKDIRSKALEDMQKNALNMGADAVAGIHYLVHDVKQFVEVFVYGTALKLKNVHVNELIDLQARLKMLNERNKG